MQVECRCYQIYQYDNALIPIKLIKPFVWKKVINTPQSIQKFTLFNVINYLSIIAKT